jgi:predicted membrane-bound spermidine synthase
LADLLGFIASVIEWVVAVFGGFGVAAIVLAEFKKRLSRERQYSASGFDYIARGSLVIPLVFSFIFLPRAGFTGMDFYVSFLIVIYMVGVCFIRPVLMRSLANIFTALSHMFISTYHEVKQGK